MLFFKSICSCIVSATNTTTNTSTNTTTNSRSVCWHIQLFYYYYCNSTWFWFH